MTTFTLTAQGQGVNSLNLNYPQPVNFGQLHHIAVAVSNLQDAQGPVDEPSIRVEIVALPDPEISIVITAFRVTVWPNPTYLGEDYRRPLLMLAETGIEVRLPPGMTGDISVSLDEQAEGGRSQEGLLNAYGQTFDNDFSAPGPPGNNAWYYSGEWVTALSDAPPTFAVPPAWTQLTQVVNGTTTLTIFRKDIEPWVTQDQLLPTGIFDSGVADTVWRHTPHLKGVSLFLNPFQIVAQPGDTIIAGLDVYRELNGWYQGTLELP